MEKRESGGRDEEKRAERMRRGVIELPEMPDVYGVYFAERKEMKRNTSAEAGSKIIILHFKAK